MKIDVEGIYRNVLGHFVENGVSFVAPPKETRFSLMPRNNTGEIRLADIYRPEKKGAKATIWYFTITRDCIRLKCNKKAIDTDTILKIAESYTVLNELIKPYMKGAENG